MNLIVEQGNTTTKVAVYHPEGQIATSHVYKKFQTSDLQPFFHQYRLTQGILSTVIEPDRRLLSYLGDALPCFLFFDEKVRLPIDVRYQTPHTLGKDRLAATVGAAWLQPRKDILIIDAGTAITYELLESSGIYHGGNISPGMTTRFKALHQFTGQLPLVHEDEDDNKDIPLVGYSTLTALQAGVVRGIIYEMDGYINDLRRKYPGLLVFLTGGHSFYFARRLKNTIFADINLVLTGLNRILEYNVENKESSSC
ncbi:MAG: type III pantothenate kinase [Tannerellaceae bacterium]|jgi:type III pantothenate kinase|nr:type III pantothenate kinase [Tannerellaceae bacterium]